MPIAISTLGHIVLRTPDLDRTVAFYRDVLGLQQVASQEFDGQQWTFLTSGRTHHELALVQDESEQATGRLHHLGFKIGDSLGELIRAKAELEAHGITPFATLDFTVSQALFIADPDGTTIELYVDDPAEPWRTDPTLVASASELGLE